MKFSKNLTKIKAKFFTIFDKNKQKLREKIKRKKNQNIKKVSLKTSKNFWFSAYFLFAKHKLFTIVAFLKFFANS